MFGFFNRRVDSREDGVEPDRPTLESTTVGPLYSFDLEPDGAWRAHFLVPLGFSRYTGTHTTTLLAPFFAWQREPRRDGTEEWRMVALPGWIFIWNPKYGTQFGWFPLWGDLRDFPLFERVQWIAFPLYTKLERSDSYSRHFLAPIFAYSRGRKSGFRVWPFYGTTTFEGRYERSFALWPFFHWQHNRLGGGREVPEDVWWFFPFVGRSVAGERVAWTFLWPFFGFSKGPREGFWGVDAPWPLVRLQRSDEVERTRIWPFYSNLKADEQDYTTMPWPLVHIRHERYLFAERDSLWVIPFWQTWQRRDVETGELASWYKAWPVYQFESHGDWRYGAFPALSPFHRAKLRDRRLGLLDRHFGWAWRLWEWEEAGDLTAERAWGGIARHHASPTEERSSFLGVWAGRRYEAAGASVHETSLLFGLVRWRVTEGRRFDMLPPAFPGPGWPAEWAESAARPAGALAP